MLCLFSSIFFRSHHIQSIFDIVNSNFFPHPTLVDTLDIYHKNNDGDNCFEQAKDNLKLVSAIFYQILISQQMIALQKLLKMFFISSKNFFLFSRYSDFCISSSPLFPPVSHYFRGWSKINLKIHDVIHCLNKNLITYFVWYLENKKRYDTET